MDQTAALSTFTFLFADIEGSTRLWEERPEATKEVMREHDNSLRQMITEQERRNVQPKSERKFNCIFCQRVHARHALRIRSAQVLQ